MATRKILTETFPTPTPRDGKPEWDYPELQRQLAVDLTAAILQRNHDIGRGAALTLAEIAVNEAPQIK